MLPIPPIVRHWLPALVLALGAASTLSIALRLLLTLPELWTLSLPFFGSAAVVGYGALGVYREDFWARGFALGVLVSSGVGGIAWGGFGIALPAGLVSMLILLSDEAPARFEQRASFRQRSGVDRAGARRLFFVALGLGLGLPALLGSPFAIVLFTTAPIAAVLAAALACAGFIGLTRLESWSFFAVGGALIALAVAIVQSVIGGCGVEVVGSSLGAVGLMMALAPLVGPVARALRSHR